jgi:ppGpp synthetase/RelA/SpoT-type nucleotidyltranferase
LKANNADTRASDLEESVNQLTPEFEEFFRQYEKEKNDYEQLSAYILMMCQKYKQRNPNNIRVVFSRQPAIKQWDSIVGKINRKREEPGRENYKYSDLKDLIGITVLCAFESDKAAFMRWLAKAFFVQEEERVDNLETGHRGLHCIIKVNGASYGANPEWIGKRCEIQVKTLLEEAFDAKSHDLAYKPGHREVSEKVKTQFAQFSEVLRSVDKQSEFLKSLIMADETEMELRRKACVSLYLASANDLIEELGIDPTSGNIRPQALAKLLSEIQQRGEKKADLPLCRYTALCALECNDELFAQQTFVLCESFLNTGSPEPNSFMGVATVEWALGDFENAIAHVKKAIDLSARPEQSDQTDSAKSTFIYLVTDWMVTRRKSKAEWTELAATYKQELDARPTSGILDTLGFYEVVFGKDRDAVEKGRATLRQSHEQAPEAFHPFYEYHDYVALKRLMGLPYHHPSRSTGATPPANS